MRGIKEVEIVVKESVHVIVCDLCEAELGSGEYKHNMNGWVYIETEMDGALQRYDLCNLCAPGKLAFIFDKRGEHGTTTENQG